MIFCSLSYHRVAMAYCRSTDRAETTKPRQQAVSLFPGGGGLSNMGDPFARFKYQRDPGRAYRAVAGGKEKNG